MITLLTKFGLPLVLCLAAFIGGMITSQKLQKMPECNCECPEEKPCNGIDFDKIKSKHLTIQNKQYLTIDGDSVLIQELRKMKCK